MSRRDRPSRSDRLKRLVEIAAAEERRVGQTVGRLAAELRKHSAQLDELSDYRKAYANKARGTPAGSSVHWKDYQDFLSRLDVAVSAQRQVVSDAEQGAAVARKRWMAKRQRLDSLEKIWRKSCDEESIRRNRQEQKRLDDLVRPDNPFSRREPT